MMPIGGRGIDGRALATPEGKSRFASHMRQCGAPLGLSGLTQPNRRERLARHVAIGMSNARFSRLIAPGENPMGGSCTGAYPPVGTGLLMLVGLVAALGTLLLGPRHRRYQTPT